MMAKNKNGSKVSNDSRSDTWKIIKFALAHAAHKNVTQVASSLTFTTVLGIVPLLAVVLSLFTAFPLFSDFQVALEEFLTSNLMPPAVSANVMEYLNQFAAKASRLTAFGSLALMVTSILLLRTIDEAFNNIWQVEQQRPMKQRVLVYWAIISLGPILTGASLWASSVMATHSAGYVEALPFGLSIILTIVPLVVTTLGFTALFMVVPNCKVLLKDALIGGFVTALALSIMRNGFAFYLAKFPTYTVIYGAFATLPIFLLWIYLSWITILSGATIAATLPGIRMRHWDKSNYAGYQFVNAVNVLKKLWRPSDKETPGYTVSQIANSTHIDSTDVEISLKHLRKANYVVASQVDETDVWVLACDPRTAQLSPLVNLLLLDLNQATLNERPHLTNAIALVMAQRQVTLATLFESPKALCEIGHMGQNNTKVQTNIATTEGNDVES